MAGHANEFPRHYPAPEQTFNRNSQPYYGQVPQSPAPGLPPLLHLSGKYDESHPAPLPSVRSIAPALHSPTYERREERGFFPQQSVQLVPALIPEQPRDQEPARLGKRSYDASFRSAASHEPLYNGMRPSSPQDDDAYDDDDEAALVEQMNMSYKRADGTNYSRALPPLAG